MKNYAKSIFVFGTVFLMLLAAYAQPAHAQSFYFIRNAATGQVLDVPDASVVSGTKINQFPINRGVNQQWQFTGRCILGAIGVTPSVDCDGYVYISNRNSHAVLDVPGSSTRLGEQIQQYGFNGGTNQQWLLIPVYGNTYKIMNRNSKKYLTVPPPYSIGTTVTQDEWSCNPYQMWYIEFAAILF